MSLLTKEDWVAETDALFHYLTVERELKYEEATALIRLFNMGIEEPISQS